MAFSYIARQPILDREKNVYGYELLFRNSQRNEFPDIHPDEATSKLLLQQHLIGDIRTVCMGKTAFINFHTNTLLHKFPGFLQSESVYIEVLETVDVSRGLVKACKKASDLGYKIALDDHDFNDRWDELLPFVSLIKVDIQQQPLITLPARMKPFREHNVPMLAERVETEEEYQRCCELGFEYFQGYFFERPEIVKRKVLAPQQMILMELLAAVHQTDIDFQHVADIIRNDLSLTYSLLKFVNSAAFNKGHEIKDIQHAIAFVGEKELKKYVALVALANVAKDQPEELVAKSLTRAHFMAELERLSVGESVDNASFMTGLLSLLDVLLRTPMSDILERLPMSKTINAAILTRTGRVGYLLRLVEAYEHGDWKRVEALARKMYLTELDIGQCFLSASHFCESLMASTQQH
ncbi:MULTISPECIES: EAL and HDOD domain-containing protein [Gammaproteobacteria]|uniref:EAL and HDOD domain-containing protein n=1 Tax=Gammaproteobacteria TaxID=1236 RepID=UPI000DD01BBA|nr:MULTISPECIES: HDOD domain-containing protein [Gammaproteobacteria]RTE85769.1 HDOD domain-containing protein [Aliidiomarina sp. B3213]TCZ90228.1 HDOD domain-containing protein [Lysobacter sp. N42]